MTKDIISYDDFAKLDIALGTILSVEQVEGADKLLRLMVDVGEEAPRQIISGIKEYFEDIQVLVGKQCPFLVNLQPRVIRGLESQGMILAGSHDATLALLIPHNVLPAGTRIR
jgi:methionine--tRNA ligase beta chain